MAYVDHLLMSVESNPTLAVGFNLIPLLVSGISVHLLYKFLLIKMVRRVSFSSHKQDVPLEKDRRIAEKLSNLIPVITVHYTLQFMSAMPASPVATINTICGTLSFIFTSVFFNEMLDIVNSSYLRKTRCKNHSIKGCIQIGKILVRTLAVTMILAIVSSKSPIIIISNLGVVAAMLMIVLQHTLLPLVANVQLSSSGVPRLGDWTEISDKNLSGEVTDITLRTITIRNWGNTIPRIPTRNFPTEIYTSWQTVFSSGAWWIMRGIATNQHPTRFLNQEMSFSILAIRGVSEPLGTLLDGRDSNGVADRWFVDNGLTNLTLFRHYPMHYLAE